MKLAVCGGRDYQDGRLVFRVLDKLRPSSVVEGGQEGADTLARMWAESRGVTCATEAADWKSWGPAAGPIRNAAILRNHKPDAVLAFPGGKGTADMLDKAERAGVRILYATQEDPGP